MVTRRCSERRFFLVPDQPEVTQLVGYCLGLAAARYGIVLHAFVFMSNHEHLGLADPEGTLPDFKAMFHGLVARGLNCLRGRTESFWSGESSCDVEHVDDDDVLRSMAYVVCNPVTAGLVDKCHQWPGLTSARMNFGERIRFDKPDFFFDSADDVGLPDYVHLELVRPSICPGLSDEALMAELTERVQRQQREGRRALRRGGCRPLGVKEILRQHWSASPESIEPRFTVKPAISCANTWRRIDTIRRHVHWRAQYADARERHRTDPGVEFPFGTWQMRRVANVRVAASP